MRPALFAVVMSALAASVAWAQPLGTFRWQLQPYCNVVAVGVTQVGGVYRLEGTDDQCGGGRDLASVQGLAFPNPDGTIGFGMTVVTAPGGAPVHVDAEISVATVSGTWRDSAGGTGTFAFTPGSASGGNPRPVPSSVPSAIRLLGDGGLLAGGQLDIGVIPASGAGARMMWYPRKAAFRAGRVTGSQWDDMNAGFFSTAFGQNTLATGFASTAFGNMTAALQDHSTALGSGTTASGISSTAIGSGAVASGHVSTAMGLQTHASGVRSTAMGETTVASGRASTAMGGNSTASGNYSLATGFGTVAGNFSFAGGINTSAGDTAFAFGMEANANGVGSVVLGRTARTTTGGLGSFMFADRSTSAPFESNAPNEFGARFAGGYYFYTRADLGTGAVLAPNGSSWATLSDVNTKEHFRDVDGEDLLARLAQVPIREWSYRAQGAAIRHMGPTAQDFRAAFGLGDFPLRINTVDADGVALAAVKALEARTRALQAQVEELRQRLDALTAVK